VSDLPAVPLVLDRKDPGPAHVVVGELSTHVDFLREALGGPVDVQDMDKLDDLTTLARLGMPGKFIWVVSGEKAINLAQDVRVKLSIWAAKPIKKRTAAIRVLSRQAMNILGMTELGKEALDALGDAVISQLGEDAPPQAMIWAATWLLTDQEGLTEGKNWKHPWEDPWGWNRKAPMAARLHVLYRDLAGWVFARDDNRAGAERLGIIPSRLQWLKTIHLDDQKVNRALVALSRWKSHPDDGFTTALIIGSIFDK
jgi:hypothetical protein